MPIRTEATRAAAARVRASLSTAPTIPGFSRVEIRTRNKDDLLIAALELKQLAGELEYIAGQKHNDTEAMILAHHKIKSSSQKLRGTA